MTAPGSRLEGLLAAKEVVIFCGPGGVGKTSIAAAAAAGAAAHLGGRVLIVTIDPARRLATALGLRGIGNVERRIPPETLEAAGIDARGGLWAVQLDTKRSWDDLIRRHAPDDQAATRILSNRLYHTLSSWSAEGHEYLAMERLYEIHEAGRYDLVVVDTPPTRHALDFVEAPRRMADFITGRLVRLLTLPYRSKTPAWGAARVMGFARRPLYQLADRIMGTQFLEDIVDFFTAISVLYDGFLERARAVERLLHDRRTTFVVVTTLEEAPLREAQRFVAELSARYLHLGGLVLNKTLPDELRSAEGDEAARALARDPDVLAAKLADLSPPELQDAALGSRMLATIAESFLNFEVVAKREAELAAQFYPRPEVTLRVPVFEADIHDLQGLARAGSWLFGAR